MLQVREESERQMSGNFNVCEPGQCRMAEGAEFDEDAVHDYIDDNAKDCDAEERLNIVAGARWQWERDAARIALAEHNARQKELFADELSARLAESIVRWENAFRERDFERELKQKLADKLAAAEARVRELSDLEPS